MPLSSSWMPYAAQGVKGFDDNDEPGIEHALRFRDAFRHVGYRHT